MGGIGWQEIVVLVTFVVPVACVVALLVLFVPNPILIVAMSVFGTVAYLAFRDSG